MHKDYCKCNIDNDKSNFSCSIDYDSLIERLTATRDEIDNLINVLKNREAKDSVINEILSSEYEETEEKNEESDEYKKIIEEVLKKNKQLNTPRNRVYRRYSYPWWQIPPYTTNWF